MMFQDCEALGGASTGAFSQLVKFVQQSRIGRICLERILVCGERPSRVFENVEVGNPEISPGNCKRRLQLYARFPLANRLVVPIFVVEQIAEVVVCPGIGWFSGQNRLER